MTEQKLEFCWKYKDYELRACPKRLVRFKDDELNETIDFIKWQTDASGKRGCFSLAYWTNDSEGYELNFVGDRPFRYIEPEDIGIIWKALKMAQKVLDGWFDMENLED